jgi:peptide deformylase
MESKQQPVILYGNPILSTKTDLADLGEKNEEERKKLADKLIITMLRMKGAGLAAPQIGNLTQVFCVTINEAPVVFFNPEIKDPGTDTIKMIEGCLSFPNIRANLNCRYETIYVEGFDYQGDPLRMELSEVESVAFQHELDHLQGITLIDHVGSAKRMMIKNKMRKFRKKLAKNPIYHQGQSAFKL